MSRLDLVTIVIVVVCLAALGFLVYKTIQLMNPPTQPISSIEDSYDLSASTDTSTYYEDWQDSTDQSATDSEDLDDDEFGTAEDGASTTTTTKPAETEKPALSTRVETYDESTTATRSAGRYLVIAGTFSQRSGADATVNKLRKAGFDNATVEIFDRGSKAVVLVDRFANIGDAQNLEKRLEDKGFEAYVKKQ